MIVFVNVQAEVFDNSFAVASSSNPENNLDEVFNVTLLAVIYHKHNQFVSIALDVLCHQDQHISCKSLIATYQSMAAWTARGERKVGHRKLTLSARASVTPVITSSIPLSKHFILWRPNIISARKKTIGEFALLLAEECNPAAYHMQSYSMHKYLIFATILRVFCTKKGCVAKQVPKKCMYKP